MPRSLILPLDNTPHASRKNGAPWGVTFFWGLRMRFAKPPETIEQQIDRLLRRGMEVPDRIAAAHFLYHLNYYRLRGYWIPFEAAGEGDGEHRFRSGTAFDQVLGLYIFDREFRLLIMDAVERIEVSVRTQWAYHLSHVQGPHAHLDRSLFSHQDKYSGDLAGLANEVDRSREDFIRHLTTTYSEPLPPIWAAVEVMSLGQLSRWYANLQTRSLRQQIADTYRMDEQVLVSLLRHLTLIRNICAHHSRLWNRRFTITPSLPRKKPAGLTRCFNSGAPRQIYNTLVILAYLMNITCPGHHWRLKLRGLLDRHPDVPPAAMGFPADWQHLECWGVLGESPSPWTDVP